MRSHRLRALAVLLAALSINTVSGFVRPTPSWHPRFHRLSRAGRGGTRLKTGVQTKQFPMPTSPTVTQPVSQPTSGTAENETLSEMFARALQSVSTPQTSTARARASCRHFENQSCKDKH
jgi:hypothetical protein